MSEPWLVVIDMQEVFGRADSPWATPGYAAIEPTVVKLVERFGERVVFTRFVAPEHPQGAWVPYYEQWPFALVGRDDPLYDLMPAFSGTGHARITRTTFGKWDAELAELLGPDPEMVLVGVSTDCCVISTALAAADAGVQVRVVEDACAGLSEADHRRALDVMALYGPLIQVVDSDELTV